MACLYYVVKAMKYVYESYDIDQFIGGVLTEYPGLCSAPHSQISSQISLRIWGGSIATSTMSINPPALVQVKLNNRWNSSLICDNLFQFSCYTFHTILVSHFFIRSTGWNSKSLFWRESSATTVMASVKSNRSYAHAPRVRIFLNTFI
jgi:hypothetical protein